MTYKFPYGAEFFKDREFVLLRGAKIGHNLAAIIAKPNYTAHRPWTLMFPDQSIFHVELEWCDPVDRDQVIIDEKTGYFQLRESTPPDAAESEE